MNVQSGPAGNGSLGAALAAFRDYLVVEAERRRALREPDDPATAAQGPALPFPAALLRRVLASAGELGEGDEAPLPKALAAEVCSILDGAPRTEAPLPKAVGASERRAQIALGRARLLHSMFRANDLAVADEAITAFTAAQGIAIPPAVAPVFRRQAVAVLSEVEVENARRERGLYPPADRDPCLSPTLWAGSAMIRWTPRSDEPSPPRAPCAPDVQADNTLAVATNGTVCGSPGRPSAAHLAVPPEAERPRAGLPASQSVLELANERIARLRASRTRERSEKVLRDYAVARDLLVELMGDMPITDLTRDACEQFKELLSSVPAMHGKGGRFRGLTAPESIGRADRDDEFEELKLDGGADPDTVRRHARLSFATINKHLASLQTCLGEHLPCDRRGKTPLIAVRFSKGEVKSNPAFRRTELTDERLAAIFHGPVFTGFGDAADRRFTAGDRLILDGCYWVPLLGLFNGMCLEEALQLRPDDVATCDGISTISIGAIHDGRASPVKTAARVRTIPVHPTLIELGFLDHTARIRKIGERRLFPKLERGGPDARFGHGFTQWWTHYRRAVGVYARGQDFHSLRHGVNRRLVRAKVPIPVVKRLMGHSEGNDMNTATYFGEVDLADMADAIRAVSYPCLDLGLLLDRQQRFAS